MLYGFDSYLMGMVETVMGITDYVSKLFKDHGIEHKVRADYYDIFEVEYIDYNKFIKEKDRFKVELIRGGGYKTLKEYRLEYNIDVPSIVDYYEEKIRELENTEVYESKKLSFGYLREVLGDKFSASSYDSGFVVLGDDTEVYGVFKTVSLGIRCNITPLDEGNIMVKKILFKDQVVSYDTEVVYSIKSIEDAYRLQEDADRDFKYAEATVKYTDMIKKKADKLQERMLKEYIGSKGR